MTFSEELTEFYRLMGSKAFWDLTDRQRHGALRGLWYSGIKNNVQNQILLSATIEFEKRDCLMAVRI